MGVSESGPLAFPDASSFKSWREGLDLDDFYRLSEMAEGDIIDICNDYKYYAEYKLLNTKSGDSILTGKTITYGNNKARFLGDNMYKTIHPDYQRGTADKHDYYKSFASWKQFRTTAYLSEKDAISPPCDAYWTIKDGDMTIGSWQELFAKRFAENRTTANNVNDKNKVFRTYNTTINGISSIDSIKNFVESLVEAYQPYSSKLASAQDAYNNAITNLIDRSFYDVITAGQDYFVNNLYPYTLYSSGLYGLLGFYKECCRMKYTIYLTLNDSNKELLSRPLYDKSNGAYVAKGDKRFYENDYIKKYIEKLYTKDEKAIVSKTFCEAYRNNYVRWVNVYLQMCAMIMDEEMYNKYFNTTDGYIKTLTDEELSSMNPSGDPDALINEVTPIDAKYDYGILSKRLLIKYNSATAVIGKKSVTYNTNRSDLKKQEYYIIQFLRWLLNKTSTKLVFEKGWEVSLTTDFALTRDEFIELTYLDDYNGALKSIDDYGATFGVSGFNNEFTTNYEKFIGDYNTMVKVYNFCNNPSIRSSFALLPERSSIPDTEERDTLEEYLNVQTYDYATDSLPIDYYAYTLLMILFGYNGWDTFKGLLNNESMLISYILYYYTKQFDDWTKIYANMNSFNKFFDHYMRMFHTDGAVEAADADAIAAFHGTNYVAEWRTGQYYDFLLTKEAREKSSDANIKGDISNVLNRWDLLYKCLQFIDGPYKRFACALEPIITYFSKLLNCSFAKDVPADSENDTSGIKTLPFLQETSKSLSACIDNMCKSYYGVGFSTSANTEFPVFSENAECNNYQASLLYVVAQELTTYSMLVNGTTKSLGTGGEIATYDRKTIKCGDERASNSNISAFNVVARGFNMLTIDNNVYAMPTSWPDKFKKAREKLASAQKTVEECSDNCQDAKKAYTTVKAEYKKAIKSLMIDLFPIDDVFSEHLPRVISYAKALMVAMYYYLYMFCSAKYLTCSVISSGHVSASTCYDDLVKKVQDTAQVTFDNLSKEYSAMKKSEEKEFQNSDEPSVKISGLMAIFLVLINNISPRYQNAVRVYYEKYVASHCDLDGVLTSEISKITSPITAIVHGYVATDKVGERDSKK